MIGVPRLFRAVKIGEFNGVATEMYYRYDERVWEIMRKRYLGKYGLLGIKLSNSMKYETIVECNTTKYDVCVSRRKLG